MFAGNIVDVSFLKYNANIIEIETIEELQKQIKHIINSKKFYFANIEGKYEFYRDDIKGIRTVGKRYSMNDWNKEYPYDDERYKKYKLTLDRYGVIYGKNYHIPEVESNGQLWGIYFPSYELPLFEALSGMKADEAK